MNILKQRENYQNNGFISTARPSMQDVITLHRHAMVVKYTDIIA